MMVQSRKRVVTRVSSLEKEWVAIEKLEKVVVEAVKNHQVQGGIV
jgi:hypothetical protein